jgi:tetratricopeptide (TPR) repeat protein
MLRGIGFAAAVLLLAAIAAAEAETAGKDSPEQRYHACMDQVAANATDALDAAEAWRKKGGGDAARHCAAAAQMALGRYAEAGGGLEAVAREGTGSRSLRASLWGQAAHAWLAADQPQRAVAASTEALSLAPGDAGLLVLRARARAGEGQFREAIGDLDRAIEAAPNNADAYVFRASAERRENALDRAAADLDRALAIDPVHPEALLERGIVRLLKGDQAGARADWQMLAEAAPKTPAAEQARINLERMEKGG